MQAQSLKEQTDHMITDYERTKGELTFQIQKNEENSRELQFTKEENKKLEDAVRIIENELGQHKATSRDAHAKDTREIVALQQTINEKERDCQNLRSEVNAKQCGINDAQKETNQWKDVCERLSNEKNDLQLKIDDLEFKNRKLIEKLNSKIYDHATQYKEKTMSALLKQSNGPHERVTPARVDSNPPQVESAFARSPLQPRAIPPNNFIKNHQEATSSQPRKSYSPLRDKKSNSPTRVAEALKDSQPPQYGQSNPMPS